MIPLNQFLRGCLMPFVFIIYNCYWWYTGRHAWKGISELELTQYQPKMQSLATLPWNNFYNASFTFAICLCFLQFSKPERFKKFTSYLLKKYFLKHSLIILKLNPMVCIVLILVILNPLYYWFITLSWLVGWMVWY